MKRTVVWDLELMEHAMERLNGLQVGDEEARKRAGCFMTITVGAVLKNTN